jgi:hypothetical protein
LFHAAEKANMVVKLHPAGRLLEYSRNLGGMNGEEM